MPNEEELHILELWAIRVRMVDILGKSHRHQSRLNELIEQVIEASRQYRLGSKRPKDWQMRKIQNQLQKQLKEIQANDRESQEIFDKLTQILEFKVQSSVRLLHLQAPYFIESHVLEPLVQPLMQLNERLVAQDGARLEECHLWYEFVKFRQELCKMAVINERLRVEQEQVALARISGQISNEPPSSESESANQNCCRVM